MSSFLFEGSPLISKIKLSFFLKASEKLLFVIKFKTTSGYPPIQIYSLNKFFISIISSAPFGFGSFEFKEESIFIPIKDPLAITWYLPSSLNDFNDNLAREQSCISSKTIIVSLGTNLKSGDSNDNFFINYEIVNENVSKEKPPKWW